MVVKLLGRMSIGDLRDVSNQFCALECLSSQDSISADFV